MSRSSIVIAIALLGAACSNGKKEASADAGHAIDAVDDGIGGSGGDAPAAPDGGPAGGPDLTRESNGGFDVRIAFETGGDVSADSSSDIPGITFGADATADSSPDVPSIIFGRDASTEVSPDSAGIALPDARIDAVLGSQADGACTGGCVIGATCYQPGQANPANPCEECAQTTSATAWSKKRDRTPCGDGVFCNGAETCSSGICGRGGSPCGGGSSCNENKRACYRVGIPLCNAEGDVVQLDTDGNETLLHDCVAAKAHGTCMAGACGCVEGYSGDDCQSPDQTPTCLIHVRLSGDDANDGSTWDLAVASVPKGLDLAEGKINAGATSCEVWVAGGIYKPSTETTGKTIQLKAKVDLYGGFAGTEDRRSLRNIVTNPTVLSGDLGNGGGRSPHVVTGATGATIDGFTITGGQASDGGGGMYNQNSSPTVTNCTFTDNSTIGQSCAGGGMYNKDSSPTVTNCTFTNNSAGTWGTGGGMYNQNSSPVVTNCIFTGNRATFGGGMANIGSSPTVTNCTFSANSAENPYPGPIGGGMYNRGSLAIVTNCTFSANRAYLPRGSQGADTRGGGMANIDSLAILSNCTFSGNSCLSTAWVASSSGGGMYNDNSSATVTNCTFSGNSCYSGASSLGGYPSAYSEGGGMANVNSSPTVTNCTFSGNSCDSSSAGVSTSLGGGMHSSNTSSSSPTVVNSIFWGDSVTAKGSTTDSEFYTLGLAETVSYSIVKGGHSGTGNIDLDPMFSSSTDGDLHLRPGSPAIDQGTGCVSSVPLTDKSGNPRWDIASAPNATGTSGVDIGAYEFQGGSGDALVTPLCQNSDSN